MVERDAVTDKTEEKKRRWPCLLFAHFPKDGRHLIFPASSEEKAARGR
ncbi:hypothetical protein AB0C84_42525 [Actinomadura sp. NPDC048955]